MFESACETTGTSTESSTDCVYTQIEPVIYLDPIFAIGLGFLIFFSCINLVLYVFSYNR